jgi:hypothetical protein
MLHAAADSQLVGEEQRIELAAFGDGGELAIEADIGGALRLAAPDRATTPSWWPVVWTKTFRWMGEGWDKDAVHLDTAGTNNGWRLWEAGINTILVCLHILSIEKMFY